MDGKGFEIEDIDGEDVRGVDYGDLYLIKMPKEGVKGLVTIKRAFNLEMSTGELLQNEKFANKIVIKHHKFKSKYNS